MNIKCYSVINFDQKRVWFAYFRNENGFSFERGNTQMQAVLNLLGKLGGCA
jgi:hypothetical protein